MADQLFVIGIGGTGMRCIEAFTHLCAIGMFDNKEIDILSIETDSDGGDKDRSEQLVNRYIRIKGGEQGRASSNSFFSAKLNLRRFATKYDRDRLTYQLLSGVTSGSEDTRRANRDLSDLLFDRDVQQFKLNHGYRAQTHLGSHLMYHAIMEAARNVKLGRDPRPDERDLMEFINKIHQADAGARVFIFGSIFGGTGASSIPIIPRAFRDAIKIQDEGKSLNRAKFGCSLLTDYFSFNVPDGAQKAEEKVIADSNNFARNSQAALQFYDFDKTVQETYQRMYLIGWPKRADYSSRSSTRTITGGGEQKNPAHVTELLCAAAAFDFFRRAEFPQRHDIVYRSADLQNGSFLFAFADFVGADAAKLFMNQLGAFFAFSHIVINRERGGHGQSGTQNLARKFKEFGTADYINLPSDDAKDIDEYVKSFAFTYDTNDVVPGWLFQVRQSVDGPFLFNSDAFSTNPKQLLEFHFGKIFTDESHQFARGKFLSAGDPYQEFCKVILRDPLVKPSAERQNVERLNERFSPIHIIR